MVAGITFGIEWLVFGFHPVNVALFVRQKLSNVHKNYRLPFSSANGEALPGGVIIAARFARQRGRNLGDDDDMIRHLSGRSVRVKARAAGVGGLPARAAQILLEA